MDIPRLDVQSITVDDILASATPVVIVKEATNWPCVSNWTWEFLRAKSKNITIPVRRGNGVGGRCRLTTVINTLVTGGDIYGIDWDFAVDLPEILPDIRNSVLARNDCFALLPEAVRPRFRWLYLGGVNTGSSLHQDVFHTHAWMATLRGRKKWVLYPPDTFRNATSARNHNAFSEEGVEADVRDGRQRFEAVIGAGDVIFVPSQWWHQVLNIEPTLGLTVNFCSPAIRSRVARDAAKARSFYSSEAGPQFPCTQLAKYLNALPSSPSID